MRDLELAKKQLYDKQQTLVITKNRQVLFQTDSHRISGFICAIDRFGSELHGASVADRVSGKALALLCVYAGIREVYAEILSRTAKPIFEENTVVIEWKEIVDNILNDNKTDVCTFEKAATGISDPNASFSAFKSLLEKMKKGG